MKKLLIATYGLYSGGVETSLLNLINNINDKYEITLLLLRKEGPNLDKLPENINVITVPFIKDYYNIFNKCNELNNNKSKLILFIFKIINKFFTITKNRKKANEFFLKYAKKLDEKFDIAIDFHGYGYFGTGYIAKKVTATKKYTWVHASNLGWTNDIDIYFDDYNKIYAVSNYAKEEFIKKYPKLASKTDIFYNIIDYEKIYSLSDEFVPKFTNEQTNILTVGRLEKEKGYDLLLDTAIELKKNGITFKWYIIGDGSLKKHISKRITDNNLEDYVIMLGGQKNPYPFFKETDIYVQTSNFEGYGLTIAEAKAFCKPIVCTNIPTFKEQIIDYENGYLCKQDDKEMTERIIDIIRKENKSNKKNATTKKNNIEYIINKID